jgi:HPt (histidine-containing phosphotransfer) domain-containing protein
MGGVAPPVLDRNVLETLSVHWGEAGSVVLVELVDLFLVEAPSILSDLREAANRGDATGARRSAHRLRGVALQVGGSRVAESSGILERCPDGTLLAQMESRLAGLERDLEDLYAALLSLREEKAGPADEPA